MGPAVCDLNLVEAPDTGRETKKRNPKYWDFVMHKIKKKNQFYNLYLAMDK